MRHVLELLDGDVARVYAGLGVPDYRPRYSPVLRALTELMETGTDARQRVARLTDRARALLPLIEVEWAATSAAAAELEAELPAALTDVLSRTERAVLSRPMRTRIADAARALATEPAPAAGDPESAAVRRAALLAIAAGDGGR